MERKTDLDPEDWSVLKSLGNRIVDDMLDFLEHIRDNKVWTSMPPEVRASFLQHSPDEGIDASNIYAEVRENIIKYGSGNVHPRFMGWVQGGKRSNEKAQFYTLTLLNRRNSGRGAGRYHRERNEYELRRSRSRGHRSRAAGGAVGGGVVRI